MSFNILYIVRAGCRGMYGRGGGTGQANIGIPHWIEEWGTRGLTGDQRRALQYIIDVDFSRPLKIMTLKELGKR